MDYGDFCGKILPNGFEPGTKTNTLYMIFKNIIDERVNNIGYENLFDSEQVRKIDSSDPRLLIYKKGVVTKNPPCDYQPLNHVHRINVYINASLAIIAASYIRQCIMPKDIYVEAINERWGNNFSDDGLLNCMMFIYSTLDNYGYPPDNASTAIFIDYYLRDIVHNFYTPPLDYFGKHQSSVPFYDHIHPCKYMVLPWLAQMIMYGSLHKVEYIDAENNLSGINIPLPVFYLDNDIIEFTYTACNIPYNVIKTINEHRLLSYEDYILVISNMRDAMFNKKIAMGVN